MIKRNGVVRLVVLILIASLISSAGITAYGASTGGGAKSELPVYELPPSELVGENISGEWHYALRSDDGYAVITEYTGHSTSIVIPARLDGIDVVGIASNAFSGMSIQDITMHGNILTIADDAFDRTNFTIRAKNGTYALKYADQHGILSENTSKYTLVDGVIDYSDVAQERIQRRGESFILFNALEGLRLSVGSLFWMEDARGSELFFRVVSLSRDGGQIVAQVEVPEVKDVIVNMRAEYTIELTEDDFVPADGVIVGENAASAKTRTEFDAGSHGIPINLPLSPAQMTRYTGRHTTKEKSLNISGNVSSTISYTVEVVNGELVYMETEETSSISISFKFSSENNASLSENPQAMKETDDPFSFSIPLGSFVVPTGWFNLDFSIAATASLSGAVDIEYKQDTITNKVYNFDTEEWEMLKDNGNASHEKKDFTLNGTITGKIGVDFSMTFKMFFINLAQLEVEGGLKLELAKTFALTDVNAVPCATIELGTFLDIELNVGAWAKSPYGTTGGESFGNSIGAKFRVFQRSFDHERLTGEKPPEAHLSLEYGFHWAESCPYGERCTVSFETKTGALLEDLLVFPGTVVPKLDEYSLPDDLNGGKHLGWATSPSKNSVDWVLGDEKYKVVDDMTLYAVWENMVEVSFDTGDGSPVQSQFIPIGGYVSEPDTPVLAGKTFVRWYHMENGVKSAWDFEEDTVDTKGLILYTEWADGSSPSGSGTKFVSYIGDPSIEDKYNNVDEQTGEEYFTYSYVKGVDNEILGVTLQGIKNNPVNLVIPSKIYVDVDPLYGVIARELPVLDISRIIFHSGNSRDEESLANIKSIRFEVNNNPNISHMFAGTDFETGFIAWGTFKNLEYVDLSTTTITSIGEQAFANCPALKCVKLPIGVKSIGYQAFTYCDALERITIPEGIETMDAGVFENCKGLKEVTLPKTLESIPNEAFHNCSLLEKVYLPEGITRIGGETWNSGAFSGCSSLKKIDFPDSLKEIGWGAFSRCSSLEKVKLPASLETIGRRAYSGCEKLKSLTLPENVNIGAEAFSGCVAISELYLSKGISYEGKVLSTDEPPFVGCTGLQKITFACPDQDKLSVLFPADTADLPLKEIVIAGEATEVSNRALSWLDALGNEALSVNLVIEEGVRSIGANAFNSGVAIRNVSLPQSLEAIGNYAFADSSLTSISIPQSVTRISEGAFSGCKALSEIDLHSNITEIGAKAFAYTAITSMTIPPKVTQIGDNAFFECRSLRNVDFGEHVTILGQGAFRHCYDLVRVTNSGGLGSIQKLAFSDCSSLVGLDNYSDLTYIGDWAFFGCTSLNDFEFPSGLEELCSQAFAGCNSLHEVDLSETKITELESAVFSHCASLEHVILPIDGLTRIRESAFSYCPSLAEITVPSCCESISEDFYSYFQIEDPSETEDNGWYTDEGWMEGCSGLKRMVFDGPSSIYLDELDPGAGVPLEEITFRNWDSIGHEYSTSSLEDTVAFTDENLSIRVTVDGPSEIQQYAFKGGTAITQVVLSDSVYSIGDYAFADCGRLELLVMGSEISPEDVAETAFEGCDKLEVCFLTRNPEMEKYLSSLGIRVRQPEMYKLTVDANGGKFKGGATKTSIQVPWCGDVYEYLNYELDFESYPKSINGFTEGILPSGWVLKDNAQEEAPDLMPRHDLEVITQWATAGFIVDGNGGTLYYTIWSDEDEDYVPQSGSRVELDGMEDSLSDILATKEGKTFKGWFYDPESTQPIDEAGITGRVIYAGWMDNPTNIEYTVRDGGAVLTKYHFIEGDDTCVCLPSSIDGKLLTGIAAEAFADDQSIVELVLPASLTDVEPGAFRGMRKLKSFRMDGYNAHFDTYDGMLIRRDDKAEKYELIRYAPRANERVSLPDEITHIAAYAFEDCEIDEVEVGYWSELISIGDYAFMNSSIYDMDLPGSLVEIGDYAFANTAINFIELKGAVKRIGTGAYQNCPNFRYAEFSADVEQLGNSIFGGCNSLLMIHGPVEDCNIKSYAEKNGHMYNIYTLELHAGSDTTTYAIQAGESLSLPSSPALEENLYFTGWFKDEAYSTPWKSTDTMPAENLELYAGTAKLFEYEILGNGDAQTIQLTRYNGIEKDVTIPERIGGIPLSAIASGCFQTGIERIAIPDCVSDIANGALPAAVTVACNQGSAAESYAKGHGLKVEYLEYELSFDTAGGRTLAAITLSKGAKIELPTPTRSGYAFENWLDGDRAVELDEAGMFTMPPYALCLTAQWTLVDEAQAQIDFTYREEQGHIVVTGLAGERAVVRIPEALHGLPVTAIEPYAFMGELCIQELTLPGSITELSASSFRNCGNLRTVTLTKGLTKLNESCFQGCASLAKITLPEGITHIGSKAFMNAGLTEIELPASLVKVESDTFEGCAKLARIGIGTNPYYEARDGVLYDVMDGILMRYPPAREGTHYEVKDTYAIAAYAFSGAKGLTSVHIGEDVWEIGEGAFGGCERLEEVTGMQNAYLTQIPQECFLGCRQLANIVIPENIQTIGARAFANCTALKTVNLPAQVSTIKEGAFDAGCVIFGIRGSEAEAYATREGLTFVEPGSKLPESISFSETQKSIKRGESFQLTPILQPSNATACKITWYSSDENIASVTQSGLVQTFKCGTAMIYAVTSNGCTASCQVNVEAILTGLKLFLPRASISVGEVQRIGVEYEPNAPTNPMLTWESSRAAVATVDEYGNVTGITSGTATITAKADNGVNASIAVQVTSGSELSIVAPQSEGHVGDSIRLSVKKGKNSIPNSDINWTSSNTQVATIDASGTLKLKALGFVTITAQLKEDSQVSATAVFECMGSNIMTLPLSLKHIGEEAFSGIKADAIIIPSGAESIAERAFANCKQLYKVVVPRSISSIDATAFEGSDKVCLVCEAGSYAYQYAQMHDIPYILR